MKLVLCLIVEYGVRFSIVRLRSIVLVFDWPNFWVSSIMFDCQTQSKSIERLDWARLPNVRLTTPGTLLTNDFPQPGQNYNFQF